MELSMRLKNVYPVDNFSVAFDKKVNLLAGDPFIPKGFLLETAFLGITKRYPESISNFFSSYRLKPKDIKIGSSLKFKVKLNDKEHTYGSKYDKYDQRWPTKKYLDHDALVILMTQSGFILWDPIRCRINSFNIPGYPFSRSDIYDNTKIREGMISKVEEWFALKKKELNKMLEITKLLSFSDKGCIELLDDFVRLDLLDCRDIFQVRTSVRHPAFNILQTTPDIQRIVSLAFILCTMWEEHVVASKHTGIPTSNQIVLLIDEVEFGLNADWAKNLIPALTLVPKILCEDNSVDLNIIATTKSEDVVSSVKHGLTSKIRKIVNFKLGNKNQIIYNEDRREWK